LVYNVGYKRSVQCDLRQLSRSDAKRICDQIEQELVKNPESNPLLKGRFAGLRKYRVGDYRVIYCVLDADVIILRIAHRRDAYKRDI